MFLFAAHLERKPRGNCAGSAGSPRAPGNDVRPNRRVYNADDQEPFRAHGIMKPSIPRIGRSRVEFHNESEHRPVAGGE